ncbi:DUF6371 domain-containing protein [Mesoflavibacter zeaxanthinifaciens]|uniref:DUF6371 domain-containing protein n=1 Tax=Mesoflavibacter zeaxanthinifaciens TaxID=393060 RepID=UPI003A93712D
MRKVYKYILDKSSKKYICPNCTMKTFVLFIDTESNSYLNETLGRCDRESKCGYFKKPFTNTVVIQSKISTSIDVRPSRHKTNLLSKYGNTYHENNFISYLLRHFVPVDVKQAIKKYFIGTISPWKGATIFWQVDQFMQVKAGKIMLYNSDTGKRVKKPYNHIRWMHKVLNVKNFVLQQCLFGLHNLCDYDEQLNSICVVESEKTAIIMSILFPANLWLATGSKANFKESLLESIKKFKIIAYPDKTEFVIWNEKVNQFKGKGFNIICSNLLENQDLEDGDDLVDFIYKCNK